MARADARDVPETGHLIGLADRGEARIGEDLVGCVERFCGSGRMPKCAIYLA